MCSWATTRLRLTLSKAAYWWGTENKCGIVTNELTDDDVRAIAQEEVEKHVIAFPHPSWDALEGDGPEDIVAKTHSAAEGVAIILSNQEFFSEKFITFDSKLDSLADVVLGEECVDFDGNVTRDGGLQKIVKDSHNGGMKVKLPASVIAALITAMAGIFGTLLILIFQHV